MSNYLTNLVRRSVGLTALVAPRAPSPPIGPEAAMQAPAAPAARGGRADAAPAREAARLAVTPTQIQIPAAEHPVPAAASVATQAPEVIRVGERPPSIQPAIHAPVRVETAVAAVASPAQAVAVAPVFVDPAPLPLPPPLFPAAAAPMRAALAREPARPSPELVPLPTAAPVVSEPPARERNVLETVRELTHRFERVIEPAAAIASAMPAAEAPAAPPPVAPLRMLDPPAVENRVVNVRIGAIEIHPAAGPAATPQPAAPPAVAQRDATTGFDRFSRLRNYAAWEW